MKDDKPKPVVVSFDGTNDVKYPEDHKAAMEVPQGGSMCLSCGYLKDAKNRICGNPYFIAWSGPNKPAGSNKIPLPVDRYCSDWYEPKDGAIKTPPKKVSTLSLEQYLSGLRKKKE